MCFSAGASIGAGVVLTTIGAVTIRQTRHASQWLFAAIPLLFGMQQFTEGVIWLTAERPEFAATKQTFTHIYLFFAQVLWPLWVPTAIFLLEKHPLQRQIQRVLVGAGVVVGVYMAYCLSRYDVLASIQGHHIAYILDYPMNLQYYAMFLYGMATILPPFFSHVRRMWMLGTTILLSYVVTVIFYDYYILSVWCFLSAVISITIYGIMEKINGEQPAVSRVIL
jgi:hypothetical protein